MSKCYELAGNKKVQCKGYYLHEIGMYDHISSPFVVGGVFITILLSIPLIASAFFCNLFYLLVLICMNSRSCFHRDFGIAYLTFVLISLVTDNMLGAMLVRGLPWLDDGAIEVAVTSHKACKYFSFLNTFLSASRANLLLAHCLLHIFSIELHTERRSVTLSFATLNALCVLAGAFMAISTATVCGVWVIGNRLVCLPDPEWPQAFILFHMIHKALFCDGIVQSLVILIACCQLRRIYVRLGLTISCLLFTTDSKFLLFDSFKRLRERTLRTRECLRVVYVHATFMAVTKITRGIITFILTDFLYGSRRLTIYESDVLENLLFFFTLFDLIGNCEVIGNLMHSWTAFFWQTTMRNTFLQFFVTLFRPFRRSRGWILSLFYTDTVTAARKSERGRKSLIFKKNFIKYARLIASRLNDENLKEALAWLRSVPNLPREFEVFIEECGVFKHE
ncbi:hypothetical protein ECG_04636 [Echinococcus granulosus]|uniref:G-protein coupled receptors family 1 profile domain-containing protein n=2 Tax=Echinococcus granulosus TaxID=6210 RepID=A0A068WHJ1_ECHGR|nr:hypothetical protein ECG_04636 [Echinococcus granulosus]CDS17074.1 hypothetical protein EgrG_000979700 [Echinococcus granulosus]